MYGGIGNSLLAGCIMKFPGLVALAIIGAGGLWVADCFTGSQPTAQVSAPPVAIVAPAPPAVAPAPPVLSVPAPTPEPPKATPTPLPPKKIKG